MPLLVRYPAMQAGSVCDDIALNVDFAATFIELAGLGVPDGMQGASLAPLLAGERPDGWQQSM